MAQIEQSTSAPSFLMDPASGSASYGQTLSQLQSRLPGAPPSYQDLLSQGVQSPLLQTVINPAMQQLQSQFQLQNQQMQDEFRSAGALGSGAQGVAMGRLGQAQDLSQSNLIAQIISQMLPTMTQGLSQQYQNQMAVPSLLASVLGQTRPLVGQGGKSMTSQPAGGGSGGMGSTSDSTDSIFNAAVKASQGGGGSGYDPLSGLDLSGMGDSGYGSYDPYGIYSGGATSYAPTDQFNPEAYPSNIDYTSQAQAGPIDYSGYPTQQGAIDYTNYGGDF